MSDYIIRLAETYEIPAIVKFMDDNWGCEHQLIHNKKIFEHYYIRNNHVQFAICLQNNIIIAICGYILANENTQPDIWVSIWLALKGKNGAGLELMSQMPHLCNARVMACNNIRPKTMAFYSFLGYTSARLPHYYRLADKLEYSICRISQKIILPVSTGNTLTKIDNEQDLSKRYVPCPTHSPYKDLWYLTRRYFDYPYHKYEAWCIPEIDASDAILITRTVNVDGVNVLRIVDYTGKQSDFSLFGFGIDKLMQSYNVEYADLYCYGISSDELNKAGFCEREDKSVNIIPNYHTPIQYENTEYYFFTSNTDNFTMFKADGDQDRPNVKEPAS